MSLLVNWMVSRRCRQCLSLGIGRSSSRSCRWSQCRCGRCCHNRDTAGLTGCMTGTGRNPAVGIPAGQDHPPGTLSIAADQWQIGSLYKGSDLVIICAWTGTAVGTNVCNKQYTVGCGRSLGSGRRCCAGDGRRRRRGQRCEESGGRGLWAGLFRSGQGSHGHGCCRVGVGCGCLAGGKITSCNAQDQ
jgi:hypothetical protein